MGIYEDLNDALQDAIRAASEPGPSSRGARWGSQTEQTPGDRKRFAALVALQAALYEARRVAGVQAFSDDACVAELRKRARHIQEDIAIFRERRQRAKVSQAEAELAVIADFLPLQADEKATRAWVAEAIASTGASSPGELGRVIGAVMKAHRAEVDGALVRRLAKEALG